MQGTSFQLLSLAPLPMTPLGFEQTCIVCPSEHRVAPAVQGSPQPEATLKIAAAAKTIAKRVRDTARP
jgi:hypothetical protein